MSIRMPLIIQVILTTRAVRNTLPEYLMKIWNDGLRSLPQGQRQSVLGELRLLHPGNSSFLERSKLRDFSRSRWSSFSGEDQTLLQEWPADWARPEADARFAVGSWTILGPLTPLSLHL
jgi:hypothetical protein